jgi:hypothetical protein
MPELFKYSYRVMPMNLSSGLTNFEIPIDGEKIVYASPTDGPEITIRLQQQSNDAIPLRPQGELVASFQRIYITSSAVAKTIYLLIGSPKDIQLTGRDVSVSGILTARTEQSYYANQSQVFDCELGGGAFVGQITSCAIWNPGPSKNLIVLEIELGYAGLPALTYYLQYITTIAGYGGFGVSAKNHNIQGPSSIAFPVQRQTVAGNLILGQQLMEQIVPNGSRFRRENVTYILGPGEGLEIGQGTTQNLSAIGYVKYIEVPA